MHRLTGHALVDVGTAGLLAFSRKSSRDQLSYEEFEQIARWLTELYTTPGSLQKLIKGMVFFNAGYYLSNSVLRDQFIDRVLYAWKRPALLGEPCIFCESPAVYRANREELPLVNGRGVINFNSNDHEVTL